MVLTTELSYELTEALALQLLAFEQMSFGMGKVQLNKIPYPVIRTLLNEPDKLSEIQTTEYMVDKEKLVWCYP